MADLPTYTIQADTLRNFVTALFAKAGASEDEAARIASHLVTANLTGHDSHGVIRVPRYITDARAGQVLFGQSITILGESPVHALLDGNLGFGQTIGEQAVAVGIEKAKAQGMSIISLRHSAHLGRIGDWAEQAADAGLISIHFVNVANLPMVAPYGGVGRRFSTDPFCIGIPPLPGRPMLLLDLATSVVAEGKVLVASNGGKELPHDALITPEGHLSADPSVLYGPLVKHATRSALDGKGAIRAFGDHKGSGLAFMCEMLAAVLGGGANAGPVTGTERRIQNNMLSIYIDPAKFAGDSFIEQAIAYTEYVKSSPPAQGFEEVLVPGEPEARARASRQAGGIPLQVDTWATLCNFAREFGVAIPE